MSMGLILKEYMYGCFSQRQRHHPTKCNLKYSPLWFLCRMKQTEYKCICITYTINLEIYYSINIAKTIRSDRTFAVHIPFC